VYSTTLRGGCLIRQARGYCSNTMDLIPALSGRHLDADAAKQCLVLQHEKIRVLLDKARGVAERALGGKKRAAARLPDAISRIRRTVEVHLQFEERALAVILEEDRQSRARNAAWFLRDHERQREGLAHLHRQAMAQSELPGLAAALAALSSRLSDDMAEEERTLAIAPAGRSTPPAMVAVVADSGETKTA
jgi:iron-sulfur cluster repair protein YtfE (RIC family)